MPKNQKATSHFKEFAVINREMLKSEKIIFLLHSVMFLTVAFNFTALEKYDS